MPQDSFSVILKNSLVYDGTGSEPFHADIAIKGDVIARIGRNIDGKNILDVKGLAVSPGFIDVHGHSDFSILGDPYAEGKVSQGITTEIIGNCGLSGAPLFGEATTQRESDIEEQAIPVRWNTFGEYLDILDSRNPSVNVATLVGHGNIRASVMGYTDRDPSPDEMDRMKVLLDEAVSRGAIGLSTGLIYPPGIYSKKEEIVELARRGVELAGSGFVYATHMRSEGDRLIESIEEAIDIGRLSGSKVQISHLKTLGKSNWHKIDRAIGLIEDARSSGEAVTCDRYPYTSSSTDLDTVLPSWVFEGGKNEELKRLKDNFTLKQIEEEMPEDEEYWKRVRISMVVTDKNKWMEGKYIHEIAASTGEKPLIALVRVLVEEELRVGGIFDSMKEENLRKILGLPYVMIGTDASARPLDGERATGKPHPRGFGSFPRFMSRYASDYSEAIRRITMLPATTFGIMHRGMLKEGFKADIVVFDPDILSDRATYEDPYQGPEGIHYVFVNGQAVIIDGKRKSERSGRLLRNGK